MARRHTRTALAIMAALAAGAFPAVLGGGTASAAQVPAVVAAVSPAAPAAPVPDEPEPRLRTTILARDKAGVLWQYETSGRADQPLKARERIGGGWNVYTSLTSLGSRTAAGEGDLVARDRSGVLWYYEGSGTPTPPSSRARG
ncbi:hypothetical protein PUR59_07985 [Streptomyces sp. SP18ES09]|uniref:hypothetical protein n=1 Tax=Streptomyces sp. SP18ES09 TaxID=3002532 RepID=UPI002E774162|nr:hypothetical protein [Streptomyces sp. SP18ES09]MEE1814950.1 hypothetical protein [Streptomyces sp. SP18ES09]